MKVDWIPVERELPCLGFFWTSWSDGRVSTETSGTIHECRREITHWARMELPEPPGKESPKFLPNPTCCGADTVYDLATRLYSCQVCRKYMTEEDRQNGIRGPYKMTAADAMEWRYNVKRASDPEYEKKQTALGDYISQMIKRKFDDDMLRFWGEKITAPIAAVSAEYGIPEADLKEKCPDCCMGLNGFLPCERHKT